MKYIFVLTFLVFSLPVLANDNPIEVTADTALEWDRANLNFTAKGNAVVKQGESSINAPTITANYSDTDKGVLIQSVTASPNAKLIQPNETLTANNVTATFNLGVLSDVEANGNVILKTSKNETLYGDDANYDAGKRVITITGNVRIEQGQNILTGNKAVFDLNTNVSTMTATPDVNEGRVKAIFYGGQ